MKGKLGVSCGIIDTLCLTQKFPVDKCGLAGLVHPEQGVFF